MKTVVFFGSLVISLVTMTASAEGARQRANIIIPDSHKAAYENLGFAAAVEIDGIIYVSGVVSELEGEGTYEERYGRGFESALRQIDVVLGEAGASLDDVVKMTTFHTDLRAQGVTAVNVRKQVMSPPHPAWTAVGTPTLFPLEGMTEIEVIAHKAGAGKK